MNDFPSKEGARREARRILEEHGIASIPIPVERIAKRLGVVVEYAPLDGDLSGLAHVRDGVPVVGVNALHHPNRQRFTLAHELGHVLLHRPELERMVHVDRGSLRRDSTSAAGVESKEIEANAFASELLMPYALVYEAIGRGSVDIEDDQAVAALAKRFKVSEAAMRFRLANLHELR